MVEQPEDDGFVWSTTSYIGAGLAAVEIAGWIMFYVAYAPALAAGTAIAEADSGDDSGNFRTETF